MTLQSGRWSKYGFQVVSKHLKRQSLKKMACTCGILANIPDRCLIYLNLEKFYIAEINWESKRLYSYLSGQFHKFFTVFCQVIVYLVLNASSGH